MISIFTPIFILAFPGIELQFGLFCQTLLVHNLPPSAPGASLAQFLNAAQNVIDRALKDGAEARKTLNDVRGGGGIQLL